MRVVIYNKRIVQQMLSLSPSYHLTLALEYFKRGSRIREMLNAVISFPDTIEKILIGDLRGSSVAVFSNQIIAFK